MNRIAILILILIVAALAILLLYRSETVTMEGLDPSEVRRQPETALLQVDTLILQARDGMAAAVQARETLNTIIDDGTDPASTLEARQRLVELEQLLGNDAAASDALLDAIQAHPGSEETPRLLFDLGLLLAGSLDRPDEAREMFKRVVFLYPDHPLTPEAMIRLTRIRMAINIHGRAFFLSDLSRFSRSNPNHPLVDEALFLCGQYAREFIGSQDQYGHGQNLQQFHEKFPDSPLGSAWSEPDITGPHIDPVNRGGASPEEVTSPKEADHE